jgi:hypothetical protein
VASTENFQGEHVVLGVEVDEATLSRVDRPRRRLIAEDQPTSVKREPRRSGALKCFTRSDVAPLANALAQALAPGVVDDHHWAVQAKRLVKQQMDDEVVRRSPADEVDRRRELREVDPGRLKTALLDVGL